MPHPSDFLKQIEKRFDELEARLERVDLHLGDEVKKAVSIAGVDRAFSLAKTHNMVRLWNTSTGEEIGSFSHAAVPFHMVFSPDGRYLAVTSSQGLSRPGPSFSMLRLWDLPEQREVGQLQHEHPVALVAFSPNGDYLATTTAAEDDKEATLGIDLWETATGNRLHRVKHDRAVRSIGFTPNSRYLLTGSVDETARAWPIFNMTPLINTLRWSLTHLILLYTPAENRNVVPSYSIGAE